MKADDLKHRLDAVTAGSDEARPSAATTGHRR
jgi:hypothetical protein